MKNKNYQLKFFDNFKDVELYKYFVPSVKEKIFQDFYYSKEKVNDFYKLSSNQKIKRIQNQQCTIFEYILENEMQGKVEEKDGIFFSIPKIELICFKTGICFLLIKTCLTDTDKFEDLLSFNYKFENINLENKNLKKLENIKIQTNTFNNMNKISEIIEEITGQKFESRKIDIDEDIFLIYTYACLEASCWNKEKDFENIENEFIKLAEIKPKDVNVNVEYDKLSIFSDAAYLKMRVNSKCSAAICSSIDTENFTKFLEKYENQYLYTYILALHQKYYLKRISVEFNKKPDTAINKFINYYTDILISEITTDSLGQKFYKRCKEKFNLEETYKEVKNKYDVFYKKLNIDRNQKSNLIISILFATTIFVGAINLIKYIF